MKLQITHETSYVYDSPACNLVQSLRLTPSVFEGQTTHKWQIEVTDGMRGPSFRDGAGDWIEGWTIRGPIQQVTVCIDGLIETRDTAGVLRGHRETVNPLVYLRGTAATHTNQALRDLGTGIKAADRLGMAHRLAEAVAGAITYRPGATEAHTTAAEALALGEGVCQDHAHALIAVARTHDMPARYVSGYLHATTDGTPHEAAHAWAELYVEGLGWVGFDAANSCCPDDRYVRLASGLDALDAAPIRGVRAGMGNEALDVVVKVEEATQEQQ